MIQVNSNKKQLIQILLVVSLCLFIRLLWLSFCWSTQGVEWSMESDSGSYIRPAMLMLEGKGFSFLSNGNILYPELIRTPGYSLFLMPIIALFQDRWLPAVVIMQIVLDAVLCGFLYYFAWRLKNRTAAWGAAIYYCMAPNLSLINMSILSESLYSIVNAFAILLFILFYERTAEKKQIVYPAIVIGLLFGFSTLIRPLGLHTVFGMCVLLICINVLIIKHRVNKLKIIFTSIVLICFLVLPVGWIARNGIKADYWSISAIDYINLLFYRAAGTEAQEEGIPFEEMSWKYRLERYKVADHRDQTPAGLERGKYFKEEAKRIILSDLPSYTMVALKGALKIMFGSHRTDFEVLFGERFGNFATYAVYAMMMMVWPVALYGVLKEPRLLPILLYVILLIVISAGPESYSRFRVPIEPLIAIGFGFGVHEIFNMRNRYESE